MKEFPIPVVAGGAGRLPADEPDFSHLRMPPVEPLRNPLPPQDAASSELRAAAAVVEQLLEAMQRHVPGGDGAPRFSLKALEASALRTLNESLGQGEVSAIVNGVGGTTPWRVQETAFAGVWRVRREDAHGAIVEDILEAGRIPGVVSSAAAAVNGARLDARQLPGRLMNAPAILEEIRHHARRHRPGDRAHVVNLSLLPLTPEDHAALDALLGEGAVSILSRGFGNCHVSATRVRGVWRVRYHNSMGTLILDTIEIVDVPESARADPEDYADSIVRLRELLRWLREG